MVFQWSRDNRQLFVVERDARLNRLDLASGSRIPVVVAPNIEATGDEVIDRPLLPPHERWIVFNSARKVFVAPLGHDPYIHRGCADGVLESLLDVFSDLPGPPELVEMRRLWRDLRRFRRERLGNNVFTPRAFSNLVVAARKLVET